MTGQKQSPRAGGAANGGSKTVIDMNHIGVCPCDNPLDGFRCCWCGTWFPWRCVGGFTPLRLGRVLRLCEGCASDFERIVNPPTERLR
jgi:hypothetical protein